MELNDHQKKLCEAGARNLREFGYPDCTADNILTTPLFWSFFKGMLQDRADEGEQDAAEIIAAVDKEAARDK